MQSKEFFHYKRIVIFYNLCWLYATLVASIVIIINIQSSELNASEITLKKRHFYFILNSTLSVCSLLLRKLKTVLKIIVLVKDIFELIVIENNEEPTVYRDFFWTAKDHASERIA